MLPCPPVFPAAREASVPVESYTGLPSMIQACEVATCGYLGNGVPGAGLGGRGSRGQMWEPVGASTF